MIIFILIVLGLCFGSFVNALVWRLYQQQLPNKKRVASDSELSISKGRSMCPNCRHTLVWFDLVPVISWLLLHGKCRYCKKSITIQYPAVEISTSVLFVVSYLFWPFFLLSPVSYLLFCIWLAALIFLIALAVYDIKWMLLPNRLVFPFMGLGVLYMFLHATTVENSVTSILYSIGGVAVGGGIFYLLFQVSSGKWIGGGDVKLGFGLGLFLGSPQNGFLMLFLASILGLIFSLPSVLNKHASLTSKVPFGPFLIASTVIVVLFGQQAIDWYIGIFLYH